MIYGSARFDDMLHVKPASIVIDQGLVIIRAWQAKNRNRRQRQVNLSFAAVGIADPTWAFRGFSALRSLAPGSYWANDFGIPHFQARGTDWTRPTDASSFTPALRELLGRVVAGSSLPHALRGHIGTLTCHSCRVTMTSALAHAGASDQVLLHQGNWSDTKMLPKYTREGRAIAVSGIKQLIRRVRQATKEPPPPPAPTTPASPRENPSTQAPVFQPGDALPASTKGSPVAL